MLTKALPCAVLPLLAGLPPPAAGQDVPERPRNYVVDRAGVVDAATEQQLGALLRSLEERTTVQMLVLTVDSTGGVPIRTFGVEVAERWKLGQAGKDNGALVVIAVKDRKYTIETGYGLEGTLPDTLCNRVAERYFVPNFKRGDYARGIYGGVVALVEAVAQEEGVSLKAAPLGARPAGRARRTRPGSTPCCWIVPFLVIMVVMIVVSSRSRASGISWWARSPWFWLFLLSSSRGRGYGGGWHGGGGWGGGGGFGGGGFGGGGFGGGGGGSFGGGGASGGW